MSLVIEAGNRTVGSVLHPTDLSEASLSAFHHALAIGIRHGAHLTLLHAVGRRATDSWPSFPSVRETLARWRAAGHTADVEDGIKRSMISKEEVPIRDPVAASLTWIERHSVDMIVTATGGRAGLARLLRPSRAERLARETMLHTLFVPMGGRPFVCGDTGRVTLRRILVPVSPATDPRPAMLSAVESAALLDDPSLEITLLHVGDGDESLSTDVPRLPYCRWSVMQRSGDVVRGILDAAGEIEADAIYVSTSWSRATPGRVEGGVTERVLAGAPCPIAAVPADPR